MYQSLRADESIPDGIRRIGLELHDAARQTLNDQALTYDERVHETRKLFKRIRAVVRLVRDEIGEEVYKETNILYRNAGRELAALRDAWVLVETVDDLAEAVPDLPEDGVSDLRGWLHQRYEGVRERVLHVDNRVDAVTSTLDDFRPRLAQLPVRRDSFEALAGGLHRIYRRGYKRMARAYEVRTEHERFHDWRKRVKYLWHGMEVLAPSWPVVVQEQMRVLHDLSDFLGDAHDLVVLREVVHAEADGSGPELEQILEAARRRQHALESAARPTGRRLYAEEPDAFIERIGAYVTIWRETGEAPQSPEDSPESAELIDTRTAAQRLGLEVDELRARIRDGKIPAQKVGNQWVLFADDLPVMP